VANDLAKEISVIRGKYKKTYSVNLDDLQFLSYVNKDKRKDLYTQRCFNKFTPTMIEYINNKINSLYVKGVGIQCKDLVETLYNNKPERDAYEGLVLAAFGLIATRSNKSNRVFYIRISDIGKTDFAPDTSKWHNLSEENNADSITTVEDMISSTVEKITRKYATGNASVRKKLLQSSNRASSLFYALGKVFSEMKEALELAQV